MILNSMQTFRYSSTEYFTCLKYLYSNLTDGFVSYYSDNIIAVPTGGSLSEADFNQIWVLFINRCHLTWSEVSRQDNLLTSIACLKTVI